MQELTSISSELIGRGGIWECENIYLEPPFCTYGITYNTIVFKRPLENEDFKISDAIKKYSVLKRISAPVPIFFEEVKVGEYHGIATNNLNDNKQGILYVTPNTARNLPSKNDTEILSVFSSQNSDTEPTCMHSQPQMGKAEKILIEDKLKSIQNIEWVKNRLFALASDCAKNGISLPEDSIFFGVDRNRCLIVDVIIADFDNVSLKQNVTVKENMSNLCESLLEFINRFCEKNDITDKEKSCLESLFNNKNSDIKN